MTIIDELFMDAPPDVCFHVAADVEQWPALLSHYRYVRFQEKQDFGTGRVEMAAWRRFPGGLRYPTWWVSTMHVDADEPAVYYDHVDGITRGMCVKWSFLPRESGSLVRIAHTWSGPHWPLIGGVAWRSVIAPHFVHVIASRTLAGVRAEAQRRHAAAQARAGERQ